MFPGLSVCLVPAGCALVFRLYPAYPCSPVLIYRFGSSPLLSGSYPAYPVYPCFVILIFRFAFSRCCPALWFSGFILFLHDSWIFGLVLPRFLAFCFYPAYPVYPCFVVLIFRLAFPSCCPASWFSGFILFLNISWVIGLPRPAGCALVLRLYPVHQCCMVLIFRFASSRFFGFLPLSCPSCISMVRREKARNFSG